MVENKNTKEFEELIRNEFKFLSYVPIVFLSAKTKKRIHTLMPEIKKVYENSRKEIKTIIRSEKEIWWLIRHAYLIWLYISFRH